MGQIVPEADRRRELIPRGGALPDSTWRARHRAIVAIAFLQVPLLLAVGLATGVPLPHLFIEVSLVALAALVAAMAQSRLLGSITATFALVTTSALLVHFSHGLIEFHFHFFVVVAIITLYQDWRPFLLGLAYVVVHHALFGTIQPHDVYNHEAALNNPRLWALIHGLFILGASAAGIATWRFNENLTTRLQASVRNLKSRESRFRALIRNSVDVVAVIDRGWTFTYVSSAAITATGHSPDDLMGRNLLEFIHPADVSHVRDRLAHLTETEGASTSLETRFSSKLGAWAWIELRASNRLSDGDIEGLVLNYHNVTERRSVQEENDKLAALVGASPDAILRLSPEGTIESWNPGAQAIYGYSTEEMIGQRIHKLVPSDEVPELDEMLGRVLAGETLAPYDAQRLRKDGSSVQVSITMFPFCDAEGNVAGIASIARDVTERHEAQSAHDALQTQLRHAQKMQSIGQLAGGIAHDFNNILAIIQNYASFLLDEMEEGSSAKDDLTEVVKASKRGAALVRQLLLFSRKEVAQPENLDVSAVISDSERLLRRSVGEDVVLQLDLASEVPFVYMDRSQLDQILINLAVNARDAMPTGGRFVIKTSLETLEEEVAQVHHEMAPGTYVCIALNDSGHGMTKDVQSQIFDPFFTTKQRGEGTGLGLATVYGIVKQAGGYIYVYSERGRGTTFRIYLPPSTTSTKPEALEAAPAPLLGHAEKILVVEDDEALRRMVTRILTGAGYDAITAGDPHEAMELARMTDDLDLLLSDVVMPVMTGRALAETIWKTRGPIRVIFMSGYTSDVITRRGELEEGVALLQKPFGSRELLAAVRKTLDAPPTAPPTSGGDPDVMIVDDEPVFRDFLKAVIDDMGHVGEVLVAGNGADAIALYREHEPRIVFLDSLRDPMPGRVLAERLRSEDDAPRIVAVTASGQETDKPWADEIIHKGARLVDEIARVIGEYRS